MKWNSLVLFFIPDLRNENHFDGKRKMFKFIMGQLSSNERMHSSRKLSNFFNVNSRGFYSGFNFSLSSRRLKYIFSKCCN